MYVLNHGRSATDPRDKVYGLLGLVNPDEADRIQPDYTIDCSQVFAKATFESMRSQGNWNPLGCVLFTEARIEDLPSWAVDFNHTQGVYEYELKWKADNVFGDCPCPDKHGIDFLPILSDPYTGELTTKSMLVDSLAHVQPMEPAA
jgi:hypothetical protein